MTIKYKRYFRKSLLHKNRWGEFLLSDIDKENPKKFLEIGIFQGVTSRNICELLFKKHGSEFHFTGIDLFEFNEKSVKEVAPIVKFSNPLKHFYFQYIKRLNPYSLEGVKDLLKKFNKNIKLIKGDSNIALKQINNQKFDYIFLDGGHHYSTVKSDLLGSEKLINSKGIIMCDDYIHDEAPGVKKAIDEFVNEKNYKLEVFMNRFAKINL